MKRQLFYILILFGFFPNKLFSQWVNKEELVFYMNRTHDIASTYGINYGIDTTYLNKWYKGNINTLNEHQKAFQEFLILAKDGMKGNNLSSRQALSMIDQINKWDLYSSIKGNKDLFIFYIRKALLEQKIFVENPLPLKEIAGVISLPKVIIDSLLSFGNLPIHVKAKLGDKFSEDSLIRIFESEYYDTINYDEPSKGFAYNLFYIGTTNALKAIKKGLESQFRVYVRQKDMPEGCPRWNVISINEYILQDYFYYYNTEVSRYFKIISFDNIVHSKSLKEDLTYDEKISYTNKGVKVYSELLSEYLSRKFDFSFKIAYKNDIFQVNNRIEPPPVKLKDEDYMRKLTRCYWGDAIIDDYPERFETYKNNLIRIIKQFY